MKINSFRPWGVTGVRQEPLTLPPGAFLHFGGVLWGNLINKKLLKNFGKGISRGLVCRRRGPDAQGGVDFSKKKSIFLKTEHLLSFSASLEKKEMYNFDLTKFIQMQIHKEMQMNEIKNKNM